MFLSSPCHHRDGVDRYQRLECHTQPFASSCSARSHSLSNHQTRISMQWSATAPVEKVPVVVFEKGSSTARTLEVPKGSNLRKVLLENKIDVYTLRGKLTNCGGGGQCGTCIVDIKEGSFNTNPRGMRETRLFESKQMPSTWRLSCCTLVEGPLTVGTKPQ